MRRTLRSKKAEDTGPRPDVLCLLEPAAIIRRAGLSAIAVLHAVADIELTLPGARLGGGAISVLLTVQIVAVHPVLAADTATGGHRRAFHAGNPLGQLRHMLQMLLQRGQGLKGILTKILILGMGGQELVL